MEAVFVCKKYLIKISNFIWIYNALGFPQSGKGLAPWGY